MAHREWIPKDRGKLKGKGLKNGQFFSYGFLVNLHEFHCIPYEDSSKSYPTLYLEEKSDSIAVMGRLGGSRPFAWTDMIREGMLMLATAETGKSGVPPGHLRHYSMKSSSSRDIWASMFFPSKTVLFHRAKAFQATSYAFPALQKSHPWAFDWLKARSSSRI